MVGAEGALQRAQGAGAHGTGAGIAVDARGADDFASALVDVAGDEALQVGVEQQAEVQLHDLPLAGQIFLDSL